MITGRRRVLQMMSTLPIVIAASAASAATTDVVLNCDTTLGPAMTAAAAQFFQQAGVRVRVFPTGPGLILPQLERQVQNDLIFTRRSITESAAKANLVGADALRGLWQNRIVIAVRRGSDATAVNGRVAVSDPTPASDMDGPAIIRALGLAPATLLGVIDTDEVAFLLSNGQADAGLLHMTDIRANPGFEVLRIVPDEVTQPITYTAAVTKLAWRPNPQAFVDFLLSPAAGAVLKAQGLEAAS